MKSILYSQFQQCIDTKETAFLDDFKKKEFWQNLEESDKERLARLFLLKAEELIQKDEEEKMMEALQCAEDLAPSHPEILCRSAALLLHWGNVRQNPHFFFLSLERLRTAGSYDPGFFEVFFEWSHLWGNIYVALSAYVNEEGILEMALQKFEEAERVLKKDKGYTVHAHEFYWDWAQAWVLLGKRSEELSDLLQGIEKFQQAAQLGCDLPHFRIDYGEALLQAGLLQGNPQVLRSALDLFKEAVTVCCLVQEEGTLPKAAFQKGWACIVTTVSKLAEMTGLEEDFLQADKMIHEAILAVPSKADFWLEWGALFLAHGWVHKTVSSLETALEKLTSSKIPECDPVRVSALLGEGVILLGLFLEDLKLIKEGEKRVLETLKHVPQDPSLLYGAGLASLSLGLYFSDEKFFQKAAEWFQKGLVYRGQTSKLWQGLFQTHMSWGTLKNNPWVLQKAVANAARLVELRPESPHHWCQWGIAYLRLYQIEKEDLSLLEEGASKLAKAMELRQDSLEPDWLFYYACALDLLGDHHGDESYYERAIDLFSQVLEKIPGAVNVRYHLAIALSHHGESTGELESFHRAHDHFQSFVKMDEEDDGVWCEWGYVLLNLSTLVWDKLFPSEGEKYRALAETKLMRAAELGNGTAHYHLACLYSLSGHLESAMNALQRAEAADALPATEDLEEDDWLESMRSLDSFQNFLSLRKQQDLSF